MNAAAGSVEAKQELRRAIRQSRKERTPHADEALLIAEHVLDLEAIQVARKEGRPIACYVARAEEPPTHVLLEQLHAAGATVLLPRVEGESMTWVQVDENTTWAKNAWGINEPLGPAHSHRPEVWVIPGLAVDADGYRLGQGGGFYDRELENVDDDATIIALVFEEESIPEVPREDHDRRVDVVVTPQRVRWLSMPD